MRRTKPFWTIGQGLSLAGLAFFASGCATTQPNSDAMQSQEVAVADRYWEYAALAAEVYATKGESKYQLVLPVSSSVLKRELAKASATPSMGKSSDDSDRKTLALAREEEDRWNEGEAARRRCLLDSVAEDCRKAFVDNENILPEIDTMGTETQNPSDKVKAATEKSAEVDFDDRSAEFFEQCTRSDKNKRPKVPLHLITDTKVSGYWSPVNEFSKYADTRGWNLFIPELAIDVWVRERPDRSDRSYEYAVVYRGTTGPGGWLSNLQIVAALTPLIWDQYSQAKHATRSIIKQIKYVHELVQKETGQESDVLITTVGHSLGGGLAQYMYYAFPQITKVVGFNSSPVDGSRLLVGTAAREENATRIRPLDRMAGQVDASEPSRIFLLAEHGEILGRFSGGCTSGRTWGSEGGPDKLCETVDLTTGSWFRQHDMNQLACKLAHLHLNRGRKYENR